MPGLLPYRGVRLYRLVADGGSGVSLQRLAAAPGSTWTTVRTHLPNGAAFHRSNGVPTRLYAPDGSSTFYYGTLRAVRAPSGGVFTVNRVGLDRYTAGVVPREMPSEWSRQSHLRWRADPRPVRRVRRRLDGGRRAALPDGPGRSLRQRGIRRPVPAAGDEGLPGARAFGLKTLTRVAITHRDGNGAWGVDDASGRAGYVQGRDAAGVARTGPVSVRRFEDVFGLGTTWFTIARG